MLPSVSRIERPQETKKVGPSQIGSGKKSSLAGEPGAREVANYRQLRLASDAVSLDKIVPLDLDSFCFEEVDLFAHGAKRDQGIVQSVSDEKTLFEGNR